MIEKAPLTLSEAIASNRLPDFIAQEEARGVGTAKRKDLDRALLIASTTVTHEQPADRTSRSRHAGGSAEKRTR